VSLLVPLASVAAPAAEPDFRLAPAVALEAELFTVERGWRVIRNGHGNYMVDTIGFQHIGGERLLGVDASDTTALAHADVDVPEAGDHRLWVRYEYPPMTEARFAVEVRQEGRTIARALMGAHDNPRYAFTAQTAPVPQWDPAWGPEGLVEEALHVPALGAGPARLVLEAVEQPYQPGVSAGRHIDFVYLTRDTQDDWRRHYVRRNRLYPILDAFRDSVGARWEARFTNRGETAATYRIDYDINRIPWRASQGVVAQDVPPGEASDWLGLTQHDVAHYHLGTFRSEQPFELELRPVRGRRGAGTSPGRTLGTNDENVVRAYIPPYPEWGEPIVTPEEQIAATLAHLRATPLPGRVPTLPLTYGGWLPAAGRFEYNRRYAELYTAIGMRGFPSHSKSGGDLRLIGLPTNRSLALMSFRNPPTDANIAKQKARIDAAGEAELVRWFDYGDEIHFHEWIGMSGLEGQLPSLWRDWLRRERPGIDVGEYWRAEWGAYEAKHLRPDSTAEAAGTRPRLYVDSLVFYEDVVIDWVAGQLRKVKAAFGERVRGGANYSAHPFYYPSVTTYVKWFRRGAADFGRHSEYFWQAGQAGPMINGYVAEHFRAGMRQDPCSLNRQYTMPHSPGNTEASFLRSAFTHLAHGAKLLDFFGIGMNECFTENYIDHRDHDRYRQIRDVTHSLGLVEDVWLGSRVLPSRVALLVSDSTERWDYAKVAGSSASRSVFSRGFRGVRLAFLVERVGLWKALTFFGESPDVLIEGDLTREGLAPYTALYVVGDSLPRAAAAAVGEWVNGGGLLFATSGAGRFDEYRLPNPAWDRLLGVRRREVELREPFFRPRQELPFLEVLDEIAFEGERLPVLASHERLVPGPRSRTLATFSDGRPAATVRPHGRGAVYYVAALPGVAYLYSALQPPLVPDRGPNTHSVPVRFDAGAEALVLAPLAAVGLEPAVKTSPKRIDARLIETATGYVVPLANYEQRVGQAVQLSIAITGTPRKVESAYQGELRFDMRGGRLELTLPSLGYGDLIRIDTTGSRWTAQAGGT
jgi:hypothetical protein